MRRGQARNPGGGGTGKVSGDVAGRRDGGGWLSHPAWHMPHKWSEPPQGTGNASSLRVCREARQRLCRGEMQGWGERKSHRGRHSPQKIKMSQQYQLMTGGVMEDVKVSVSLSGKYPASHMFPDGKLLQQKSQTRPHTAQAGGLVRLAVMPGRGAVLPGAAQTWWCQTQTRCAPATAAPAWLSRCPLSLAAGASSPGSSQLLCSGT